MPGDVLQGRDESELEDDADDEATGIDDELTYVALYVELMGRRSNLILVDDNGLIMESAKRVTPDMSRVRTVLPRLPYQPPPPPPRLDPRTVTRERDEAGARHTGGRRRAGARPGRRSSRRESAHGQRDRVPRDWTEATRPSRLSVRQRLKRSLAKRTRCSRHW